MENDEERLEQMNRQLHRRDAEITGLKKQIRDLERNVAIMEKALCEENAGLNGKRKKRCRTRVTATGDEKWLQDAVAIITTFIVRYCWVLYKTAPNGWDKYLEVARTLSCEVMQRVKGVIPGDIMPRVCWSVHFVKTIRAIWSNERADSVNRMKLCFKGEKTLI